ncbi:MAG: GNAT family N-acetyltransferase [Alphaproteobacteria bacterium]|nr:GNAT family N-acetyltransferase [Alphaproteobacteria bacterium]
MQRTPPQHVETERLIPRKLRASDAPSMLEEYAGDPRVTRFLIAPTQTSLADAERFIAARLAERDASARWTYTITERNADERAVGRIALKTTQEGVSIGYALAYRLHGRGLATEALEAAYPLAHAMNTTVFARVDPENTASIRVLEKCGFCWSELRRRSIVLPNIGPEARDCAIYIRQTQARDIASPRP